MEIRVFLCNYTKKKYKEEWYPVWRERFSSINFKAFTQKFRAGRNMRRSFGPPHVTDTERMHPSHFGNNLTNILLKNPQNPTCKSHEDFRASLFMQW